MKSIKIKAYGEVFDITQYVDPYSIQINKTIEEQIDSGSLSLRAHKDTFTGLWLDKRIPTYSVVEIDLGESTHIYTLYLLEDNVDTIIPNKVFSHTITLIGPEKYLQLKTIPDMTVTIPGDLMKTQGQVDTVRIRAKQSLFENVYNNSTPALNTFDERNNYNNALVQNSSCGTFRGNNMVTNLPEYNNAIMLGGSEGLNKDIEWEFVGTPPAALSTLIDSNGKLNLGTGYYKIYTDMKYYVPNISGNFTYRNPIDVRDFFWAGETEINTGPLNNQGLIMTFQNNIAGNIQTPLNRSDVTLTGSRQKFSLDAEFTLGINQPPYYANSYLNQDERLIVSSVRENTFNHVTFVDNTQTLTPNVDFTIGVSDAKLPTRFWTTYGLSISTISVKEQYVYPLQLAVTSLEATVMRGQDAFDVYNMRKVIEKILKLTDKDIELDEYTATRLQEIPSPEFTFSRFTSYDAIKQVADTVGAIPKLRLPRVDDINGKKVLYFIFYSDIETSATVDPENIESTSELRPSENYIAALELNADNIVDPTKSDFRPYTEYTELNKTDPVTTDWLTVRSINGANQQLTTDNIGLVLDLPIRSIIQVEVKGLRGPSALGFDPNKIYKLMRDPEDPDPYNRVLEKTYYDTLPGDGIDPSDKTSNNFTNRFLVQRQNNSLYYVQGENKIYGMGFFPSDIPRYWDMVIGGGIRWNRSIYETLYTKQMLIEEYTSYPSTNLPQDEGKVEPLGSSTLTGDSDLRFRVTFIPYTSSRATIYKEDQSGFQEKGLTKYYNEYANVNDPKALGEHISSLVNRLGNTHINYIGKSVLNKIPDVGQRTSDNKILTSISINPKANSRVDYNANYIQDFSVVSDYVGVRSELRQFEIPNRSVVRRDDKISNMIKLSKDPRYPVLDDEIFTYNQFLHPDTPGVATFFLFFVEDTLAPLFAEITTYNKFNDQITPYKIMRPVNITSFGNTLTMTTRMEDNYSAGLSKRKVTIGGVPTYFTEEVPYSDSLGNVSKVDIKLVNRVENGSILSTDPRYDIIEDMMPYMHPSLPKAYFTSYTYDVDKDAREILGFVHEVIFQSEDNSITVYPGLAKHNPVATKNMSSVDIKIAPYKGNISKSARTVNRNQVDLSREASYAQATSTPNPGEVYRFMSLYNSTQGEAADGLLIWDDVSGDLMMKIDSPIDTTSYSVNVYFGIDNTSI